MSDKLGFELAKESLLVFLNFGRLSLSLSLFHILLLFFRREFPVKISLGMFPLVMLSQVDSTGKYFLTVLASHGLSHIGLLVWYFQQILVGSQGLLLKIFLLLEVLNGHILFGKFRLDASSRFISILVLQIQSPSKALKVVLRVNQILNSQLRQSK